jgi:hypothetical protein
MLSSRSTSRTAGARIDISTEIFDIKHAIDGNVAVEMNRALKAVERCEALHHVPEKSANDNPMLLTVRSKVDSERVSKSGASESKVVVSF